MPIKRNKIFLSRIRKLASYCLDIAFPRFCVACGDNCKNSHLKFICNSCESKIEWIHYPCCSRCSSPFYGRVSGQKECPNCQKLNPYFKEGRSLFFMKNTGRELIHTLKYQKGLYLKKDIQTLVLKHSDLSSFFKKSVLVPVPLHPKRYFYRGFNQSLFIANALVDIGESITVKNILKRVQSTHTQTSLDRESRQKNVKNAFALSSKITIDPTLRYIIIDDVFTTGSTLNACSKVLCQAGARNVSIFTLGHG